jgi:EAL domain-containing protein (putative c-di-GMP-specific phosphodiesterase class I)
VNVSPQELLHPGYPGLVALVLEVTETALIPDERGRDATLTVRILRELGVRVFLDDFGSGYSSLERLAALPVDGLKLPRPSRRPWGTLGTPKAPPPGWWPPSRPWPRP